MRINRAKNELKKVLRGIAERPGVEVNIIAYSTHVRYWRGGAKLTLHNLKGNNLKSALEFVDGFQAYGVTCTDDALESAFEVEGARCFYLLSDGKPSRDGQTEIPTEEILSLVERLNRFKKIRIHTLGFRGAKREFMEALANATGGKYSDIH